jgi:hypothetical protein
VSACVDEILASDLAERRAAVRAWLVESDPNRAPAPPSSISEVGGTANSTRLPDAENSAPRMRSPSRWVSLGVGALAAGMAVAAGFGEWEQLRKSASAASLAVELTAPAESPPESSRATPAQSVPPLESAGPVESMASSEPAPIAAVATPSVSPGSSVRPVAIEPSIRPARPASAPVHKAPAPSASASPAMPNDMVVNPYR